MAEFHVNLSGIDLHQPRGVSPTPLTLVVSIANAYQIEDPSNEALFTVDTGIADQGLYFGGTKVAASSASLVYQFYVRDDDTNVFIISDDGGTPREYFNLNTTDSAEEITLGNGVTNPIITFATTNDIRVADRVRYADRGSDPSTPPAGFGFFYAKDSGGFAQPHWINDNGDVIELGAGGGDADAIHDNVASEISAIANKATAAAGDFLVIEDSAAANIKKHILISGIRITESQITDLSHTAAGGSGTDLTAIHDDTASEISALSLVTAVSGDHILIEDASDANNKKRVAASDFLGGGGHTMQVAYDGGNVVTLVDGSAIVYTGNATAGTSEYMSNWSLGPENYIGTPNGLLTRLDTATSINSGSDVYGHRLIGRTNVGGGSTVGLKISDFDIGMEIDDLLLASAGVTITGGDLNFTGVDVDLDPTGTFDCTMDAGKSVVFTVSDNIFAAFRVQEGINLYLEIVTTDGSERIQLGNAGVDPQFEWAGAGDWKVGGGVGSSGQFLKSLGSGSSPVWATVGGGGVPHDITAGATQIIVEQNGTTGSFITAFDNSGTEKLELMGNNVSRNVHIGDSTSVVDIDAALYFNSGDGSASDQAYWILDSTNNRFEGYIGGARFLMIDADDSVTIVGEGSTVTSTNNVILGSNASIVGDNTVCIGDGAEARATAVVIGQGATATGGSTIAIGRNADASNWVLSVVIGQGALAKGGSTVSIGHASRAGADSVAIGQNCDTGDGTTKAVLIGNDGKMTDAADYSIGIGGDVGKATAFSGASSIGIGGDVAVTHDSCLALGREAATQAANQAIFGSGSYPLNDFYLGQGYDHTSAPNGCTIHATGGNGTDIAGGPLTLAGGKGTGTALPGKLTLQVSHEETTGSTVQTLFNYLEADGADSVQRLTLMKNDVSRSVHIGDSSSIVDVNARLTFNAGDDVASFASYMEANGQSQTFDLFVGGVQMLSATNFDDSPFLVLLGNATGRDVDIGPFNTTANINASLRFNSGNGSSAFQATVELADDDLILDNPNATGATIIRLGTDTSATIFEVRGDDDTVHFSVDGAGTVTGGGGAVDPSVISSNQEYPSANGIDDALSANIDVNEAIYIPFHVSSDVTIKRIGLYADSATGNVDVGIYELDGTRIVSSGSTAMSGTNQAIIVNISDTALTAGRYYMAVVNDSSTPSTRFWFWTETDDGTGKLHNQLLAGLKKEESAFPLPATATFADPLVSDFGVHIMSLLLEA